MSFLRRLSSTRAVDLSLLPISIAHFRLLAFGHAFDFMFNRNGLISLIDAVHPLIEKFCSVVGAKDRIGEINALACPNMENNKESASTLVGYMRKRVMEPPVTALKGFFLPIPLGVVIHQKLFSILLDGLESLFVIYGHLESQVGISQLPGISCVADKRSLSISWTLELLSVHVLLSITGDLTIRIVPTRMLLDMVKICPVSAAQCDVLSSYLTKKV